MTRQAPICAFSFLGEVASAPLLLTTGDLPVSARVMDGTQTTPESFDAELNAISAGEPVRAADRHHLTLWPTFTRISAAPDAGPTHAAFDPRSLRTRLALVLAAAVAVPLVVLVPDGESGNAAGCVQVLLLPDLGTAPVARYRPLLRTLLELRQYWWAADNQDEPLLVVATVDPAGSDRRTAAWRSLLQRVASNLRSGRGS